VKKVGGEVKIPITGNRSDDFYNFWLKIGVDPVLGSKVLDELQLTLHHLDDLDGNLMGTLQLVLRSVHRKTYKHIGSHDQLKELKKLAK